MQAGFDVGSAFRYHQRIAFAVDFQQLRAVQIAQRQQLAGNRGVGADGAAGNQTVEGAGFGRALHDLCRAVVVDLQPLQDGGNGVTAFNARFAPVALVNVSRYGQRRQGNLFNDVAAFNRVGDGVRGNTESRHDADEGQQQREQDATPHAAVKQGAELLR